MYLLLQFLVVISTSKFKKDDAIQAFFWKIWCCLWFKVDAYEDCQINLGLEVGV
jgi:hypothetical protein